MNTEFKSNYTARVESEEIADREVRREGGEKTSRDRYERDEKYYDRETASEGGGERRETGYKHRGKAESCNLIKLKNFVVRFSNGKKLCIYICLYLFNICLAF